MKMKTTIFGAAVSLSLNCTYASNIMTFQPIVSGVGIVNVTSNTDNSSLVDPANNSITGKKGGQSWGDAGLLIDGQQVIFTLTSLTDYAGTVHTDDSGNAFMRTDGLGMAIDGGGITGDRGFVIDGHEQFTFAGDKALIFEAIAFREFQDSEAIIQSDDWIGLSGVSSKSGFSYNSAAGAFTLTKDTAGSVTAADLVGDSGPELFVGAGVSMTIDNSLNSTVDDDGFGKVFAIQSITYSAALVPEPSSTMLIGLSGVAMLLRRRR